MNTTTPEPGDDETARVLAERARLLAMPRSEPSDGRAAELHLVVRVGERRIAIPAVRALHIRTATPLTRLVETGAAMSGLAVVLGELVPVADLGALLQIDHRRTETQRGYFALVDDDGPVALLVDDVIGLRSLDPSSVVDDLEVTGSGRGLIVGVAAGGLNVLDVDAALNSDRMWPPTASRAPTS